MSYIVFRVDPIRRTVLQRKWPDQKRHYQQRIAKEVASEQIAHAHLLDIDGKPLMVAAAQYLADDVPGFKIRGLDKSKITVGYGLLFGLGPNSGFVGAPVDMAWCKDMILWLDPEECVEEPDPDGDLPDVSALVDAGADDGSA